MNKSSWCCDNLIDLLEEYSKENGCICSICEAKVLRSEYMEQTITLTTSKSGDWQILEINGTEWASGHSISNVDWLGLLSEHFNCQIEVIWISDEEMEARC